MTTRRPGRRDSLEAAIEAALQPGRFIAYRAGWDFVSILEEVAGQLDALVRTDARRAVSLYETFLAGCYEKAEELDDSGGNFSMFVVTRAGYCAWQRRGPSARRREDEVVGRQIQRIVVQSRGTYGSPRVHRALRASGVRVNRRRVERPMLNVTRLRYGGRAEG